MSTDTTSTDAVRVVEGRSVPAAGTWTIDPSHSTVGFTTRHLMVSKVRGHFAEYSADLTVAERPEDSKVDVTIQVASVSTADEGRDGHLLSADFFDAETFPQLTFASETITPIDDETFTISGKLALHGVTNPITLTAVVQGLETDPWGNERVGLEITGKLSRGDYGMKFNQALGSGNVLVSDQVKLSLDVSAVKQAA